MSEPAGEERETCPACGSDDIDLPDPPGCGHEAYCNTCGHEWDWEGDQHECDDV
jgi:hypothetical protein